MKREGRVKSKIISRVKIVYPIFVIESLWGLNEIKLTKCLLTWYIVNVQ